MAETSWQRRSGIMLCYPFEEKRLTRWNTPAVFTQPKLDGDRCRVLIYPDGHCLLLSSEENEIVSVPHINYEIESKHLPPMELDGELYIHGVAHQSIHSIVSRKVEIHPNFECMQLHIFDIINGEPQVQRQATLANIFEKMIGPSDYIKEVKCDLVKANSDNILEQMYSYYDDGYEGIIVRSPFGYYTRKRSIDIMKFKPRKDDHYIVVGYEEEISKDGEPKNALGALILKSDVNQIFKVGSGSFLTRENRRSLWERKEQLIGQIAHVKYQHLTEGRVPRFPVLIELLEIQRPE